MKTDGRLVRGARTKERILDEAALLAREGGLSAVSVKNLAARAGLSLGALYRHFGGVEDVVLAMRCRALAILERFMADRGQRFSTRDPALARLWGVLGSYRAFAAAEPRWHALLDGLLSDPDRVYALEQAQHIESLLLPVLGHVERALAEAVAAGALVDGDHGVRTRVAWAQALGLFHLQKRDRLEPAALQSPRLFREGMRTLLLGWGGDAEEVDAAFGRAMDVLPDVVGSP